MGITSKTEHPSRDRAGRRRKQRARAVPMDRSLEGLPLFRLSDSAELNALSYSPDNGGRWRVLAYPGDRLPGTFDQDVYVEILRRFHDAGSPPDGAVSFTLHDFLRSMGRRVDGRTYEQMRSSLTRLERTVLESSAAYYDASAERPVDLSFSLLSSVSIQRRRAVDRDQLMLFPVLASGEPGVARVVLAACLRTNLSAGHTVSLEIGAYSSLQSAVARRLYRVLTTIGAIEADGGSELTWLVPVLDLARMLPLTQRYPSHLLRVLHPAHEMLISAGLIRGVIARETDQGWVLEYSLSPPPK